MSEKKTEISAETNEITELSDVKLKSKYQGTVIKTSLAGALVDIGLEIAALITTESVKAMELRNGKKVWVNFKASATQYVEE